MVGLSCHIGGRIGGQHNRHTHKLFRTAGTPHGDSLPQIVASGGMIPCDLRQFGKDVTGTDGIAANTVLGKFHCHRAGQRHNAAFGCAIYGTAAQHPCIIMGTDVDDVAGFLPIHLPGHRLTYEKKSFEVGIHNAIVGFGGNVQEPLPLIDPGYIKQHINFSILLDYFVHATLNAVQIGHIQMMGGGFASRSGYFVCQDPAFFEISAA